MTTTEMPGCTGLPDCGPPDPMRRVLSAFSASAISAVSDVLYVNIAGDELPSIFTKSPDIIPWLFGHIIMGVLFSELYIYYARRPMTSFRPRPLRNRTNKGIVYGVAIACIVLVPSVFIDYATLHDYVLNQNLLYSSIKIVMFALCGVWIAHLLKKDV